MPVSHTCGKSAWRIRLTVHRLQVDRVWYLVLVQAYQEPGRANGDRAWCQGVVVTTGWKARTDNKRAVHRDVKEIDVHASMRTYDIGRHTVYCHYSAIAPKRMPFSNCQPINIPTKIFEYDDVARVAPATVYSGNFHRDLATADQCQNG